MDYTRHEFILIGAHFNTPSLGQWTNYVVKTAEKDKAFLAKRPVYTATMKDIGLLKPQVQELEVQQKNERKSAPLLTVSQNKKLEAARLWWVEAKNIAKMAYENASEQLAKFRIGVSVGSSVSKLHSEIEILVKLFKENEKDLADFGGTKDFVATGAKINDELETADADQESNFEALPETTAALYEAKGKLYTNVRRIVRLGRTVFLNQPEKAAKYNYDILRRRETALKAAKTRKNKKETQ